MASVKIDFDLTNGEDTYQDLFDTLNGTTYRYIIYNNRETIIRELNGKTDHASDVFEKYKKSEGFIENQEPHFYFQEGFHKAFEFILKKINEECDSNKVYLDE